ncbi:hypothetical protein IP70_19920 [alpha proteobacterium AAP38]|nr:hypothetical protein IP70_19920 [alpha proteobacterium AAP38]
MPAFIEKDILAFMHLPSELGDRVLGTGAYLDGPPAQVEVGDTMGQGMQMAGVGFAGRFGLRLDKGGNFLLDGIEASFVRRGLVIATPAQALVREALLRLDLLDIQRLESMSGGSFAMSLVLRSQDSL